MKKPLSSIFLLIATIHQCMHTSKLGPTEGAIQHIRGSPIADHAALRKVIEDICKTMIHSALAKCYDLVQNIL